MVTGVWIISKALADWARRLAALWRALMRDGSASYRPERHYMRGPGPKWRQKHSEFDDEAR